MTRIELRPLRVEDAEVMAAVLADPALYEFTGGHPPTREALVKQYAAQVRGRSSGGSEEWINLIIEWGDQRQPVGYVQATVTDAGGTAEIAWVVGTPWQRQGIATRATTMLMTDLVDDGVGEIIAHIHPAHTASQRIAENLGMNATDTVVDGEVRWMRTAEQPLRPGRGRRLSSLASDVG
ncbi:GNAT family N-acetyltransferase [Brevibacterium sanguinis]|uniref:GNAT family N-acetyltransferase n=1 Tax=Brevibacterium sanguinis TaxID=232444 RepID=UPI0031DAA75A